MTYVTQVCYDSEKPKYVTMISSNLTQCGQTDTISVLKPEKH